jgi:hypothetical protein
MMTRTQITLDPELQREARRRASDLGISLAEYIRRLVARDLRKPEHRVDPTAVFNLGSSAGGDVARDKDDLIGRAVASKRSRYRSKP